MILFGFYDVCFTFMELVFEMGVKMWNVIIAPLENMTKLLFLMISAVQQKYYKPIKKGTFVNESLPF